MAGKEKTAGDTRERSERRDEGRQEKGGKGRKQVMKTAKLLQNRLSKEDMQTLSQMFDNVLHVF